MIVERVAGRSTNSEIAPDDHDSNEHRIRTVVATGHTAPIGKAMSKRLIERVADQGRISAAKCVDCAVGEETT